MDRFIQKGAVCRKARLARRSRIGFFVFPWALLLVFSCTGTLEEVGFPEQMPVPPAEQEAPSFPEREFRFALLKLENGDFEGARETLSEIAEREEDPEVTPQATFALGVLKLLDMENGEKMLEGRDYFQAYASRYPDGPYREHAERIAGILSIHVNRSLKEQRQIQELAQKVNDQEKVIQTLQYKIEKLEEIHRETEEKRHLLDGA